MKPFQFYGRRKGRPFSPTQKEALEKKLPLVHHLKDLKSPLWLEIGFGAGDNLLFQLKENPTITLVGIEPFLNGVAHVLSQVTDEDLGRLRIFPDDIRLILKDLPTASFDRIYVLFPDPWPKKKHGRRRLLNQGFFLELERLLHPKGELRIATDDIAYREEIETALPSSLVCQSLWEQGQRPEGWPLTRYERKANEEGRHSTYFILKKA